MWTRLNYDNLDQDPYERKTGLELVERARETGSPRDVRAAHGAIIRCRERIKRNSERSRAWKHLLRSPHTTIYERSSCMIDASQLQGHVWLVQRAITRDLIQLHHLRGTRDGGRSHLYKRQACQATVPV